MPGKKKNTPNKIDKSAEYLKILLDNTIKGFILLDKDFKVLMFNAVADKGMRYFYKKPMEINSSYWEYVEKKENASFIRHFEKALKKKK